MFRLLLAASLVTLVSCSPKSSGLIDKSQNSSIVNGQDVKQGAPITSSIVALLDVKENYLCTGSLIAPNIVLTAAHCMPQRASDLKVVFANNIDEVMKSHELGVVQSHILDVTDFKANAKWKANDESVEFNTGDIALVKFKGQIPEGYKPATFLPDTSVLQRGTVVTVAGYGVSIVDTKTIDASKYRNLDQAISAGEVICDDAKSNCKEVEMSGDGLLRQTQAPISSVQETEVILDERKAGTCNGDSGGPAYIEKDGQFYLFGLTSRGSLLCNDRGIYTNALEYKQWIVDTINQLK